jgi:type III secretion protein T
VNPGLLDIPALFALTLVSSLRTLVAFTMLPFFATSSVPAMVRTGIALAVVLPVVAARLEAPAPLQLEAWPLVLLIVREGAVGVVIGLGFGAFCTGLQAAGEIIDHQTGLTFTQNIDPTFGNTVSITSHLLERVLFAVLMSAGIMLVVVDALYLSYELWPVGKPLPSFERLVPFSLVAQSSRLFSFALLIAGPVLLVLFVVDASLGMLNRAAPQLGIFNLALSLKPIIGIAVLVLALPMLIEHSLLALGEFAKVVRAMIMFRN